MLRYELKLDGTNWTDVGGLILTDSPFDHNLCSTTWKGVADTATFTLRFREPNLYRDVVLGLIKAQEDDTDVECRITDLAHNKVVFLGSVDLKKIDISSSKIPDTINVTCSDISIALDEKMLFNKVFHKDENGQTVKVGTVVTWLLNKAGLTTSVLWDEGIELEDLELPLVITEEDKKTYREVLSTLLQEMGGYVLKYEPEHASFAVRKVNKAVRDGESIPVVHYHVPSKLKSSSSRFTNDGVSVIYGNVKESKDNEQLVYLQNVSISDGVLKDPSAEVGTDGVVKPSDKDGTKEIPLGDVVPVGGYYPLDSDVQKTYQEYNLDFLQYDYNHNNRRTQDSAIKLHYVKPETVNVRIIATDKDNNDLNNWYENVGFYSSEGKFFYPQGGEFYPRKAWQILHNKTSKCINVKSMAIFGQAVYSDKETRFVMPLDCRDPFEYTTSNICSEARVEAFATFLMNLKKHGGDTSTWTARWDDHELGDHVYVEHKSASKVLSVIVRKSARKMGNELWAEYTAVHVGAWEEASEYGVTTTTVSSPDGQNDYTRLEEKAENKVLVQYAVIPSDVDFGMGEGMGYGADDSYGFSADEAYGAEWEWTDGQIDPSEALDGYYVWQRTSTDGGKTWRYTRLTGQNGKVFTLKADSLTYEIDLRSIGGNNDPITVTVEKSGYRGDAPIECVTAPSYFNESTGVLTVPKNTPHSKIIMKATLEGADNQYLTITGIDNTQYGSYLGKDIAGIITLDGDFYVDTTDNLIKYKKNGEWFALGDAGLSDGRISEIAGIAQKDALSLVQSGTITMSEYAYLTNVIANTVAASYINVGGAIYGGGYNSQGENATGTKGFHLGADGQFRVNDVIIEGEDSTFQSDVFSTKRSEADMGPYNIEDGTSIIGVIRDDFRAFLDEFTKGAVYKVLTGTVSYLVGTRRTTFDVSNTYLHIRDHHNNLVREGSAFRFTRTVSYTDDEEVYVAGWHTTLAGCSRSYVTITNLTLSTVLDGVGTKNIMPMDDNIYTLGTERLPYDVRANELFFKQVFQKDGLPVVGHLIESQQYSSLVYPLRMTFDNGFVVMGGYYEGYTSGTTINITTMANTNYLIFLSFAGATAREKVPCAYDKTTSGFKVVHSAGNNDGFGLYWLVIGKKADS